ncbi:hypothetical protein PV350_26815 [Streptomyces sp. PA03-6a]|nr:hypothetical protein [Streptomyces sp. PA03-6a]
MKGARVAALTAGLAAGLTLAGCGVPPSDVIEAGAPASGMFYAPDPAVAAPVSLYFLLNGDPTPVGRKLADPSDVAAAVRLLFDGPAGGEADKVTTELPHLAVAPEVTVGKTGLVSVRLPEGIPPLSHPAMLQLACTVSHVGGSSATLPSVSGGGGAAASPSVAVRDSLLYKGVDVRGDGWTMTQSADACPDADRS